MVADANRDRALNEKNAGAIGDLVRVQDAYGQHGLSEDERLRREREELERKAKEAEDRRDEALAMSSLHAHRVGNPHSLI